MLAGLATDESSQTEIDRTWKAIHRDEAKLNQPRKTTRLAEERLGQARKAYDAAKASVLAVVTKAADSPAGPSWSALKAPQRAGPPRF